MKPISNILTENIYSVKCLLVLSLISIFATGYGLEESDEPNMEKMVFKSPDITEEESKSKVVPEHLKCDSCKAIAFQINNALNKATRNKMRALTESDVIEALENVCKRDFLEYGMKSVNGRTRLSGPGTEAHSFPGMMQMGGLIAQRLQDMCDYFIGEIEEMPIYRAFTEDRSDLISFLCFGNGIHDSCNEEKKDEL